MDLTPNLGIPYPNDPTSDTVPDLNEWMANLALAVDSQFVRYDPVTSGAWTAATGWTLGNMFFQAFGPMCMGGVNATRTGAAIAMPSSGSGDITNVAVAQLALSQYYPPSWARGFSPGDSGRVVSGAMTSTGELRLAAVAGAPASASGYAPSIAVGDSISLYGCWFRA